MPNSSPVSSLLIIGVAAGLALAALIIGALRLRPNAEKREQKRRLQVHAKGRIIEGVVMEATPDFVHYRYQVSGVEYETAQDVRPLVHMLPENPHIVLGPVSVKYIIQQPANSIVVCEQWSGLRNKSESELQAL